MLNLQSSLNTRTRLMLYQWVPNARPPPCTCPLCRVTAALMQEAGSVMSARELLDLCHSERARVIREELAAEAERHKGDYFDTITFAHLEGCLLDLAEAGKVRVFAVERSAYPGKK